MQAIQLVIKQSTLHQGGHSMPALVRRLPSTHSLPCSYLWMSKHDRYIHCLHSERYDPNRLTHKGMENKSVAG